MEFKVKKSPKGIRKFFFWRKAIKPDTGQNPDARFFVLPIPEHIIEKGVLVWVDKDGARPVPGEAEAIERIGRRFEILYDPNFRGSWAWTIRFEVPLDWEGQTFGQEGIDIIREVGLNLNLPWASEFRILDDGRIEWSSQLRPRPDQIIDVIHEATDKIQGIMRSYWFHKKAELVRMAKKKT